MVAWRVLRRSFESVFSLQFLGKSAAILSTGVAIWPLSALYAQQSDNGEAQTLSTKPGEIRLEPSTYHSVAVRWPIVGDSNRTARVTLHYKEAGQEDWVQGYPLFRPMPERISADNLVPGGWLFAGSVVDLTPASDYIVRLTLQDEDGVIANGASSPELVKEIRVSTRAEPGEVRPERTFYVVPEQGIGGDGSPERPFRGLEAAEANAQPGDLFVLRPGLYSVPGHRILTSGRSGQPIVYRGEDGAILDGAGSDVLLDANDTAHRWFEGLVFQNADRLLTADKARHLVVRQNRFNFTQYGITSRWATYAEAQYNAVLDNVFQGVTTWPRSRGIEEVYGVELTGSGHVIAYNLFRNVGDAVHNGDRGRLSASDIYGNEIVTCTDDGIETDYSDTNVRVFRNRITNCFAGITGQPVHGGPVYIFRNAIYNTQYAPFKLHNHTSGMLLFHNTSVRAGIPFNIQPGRETVSNVVTRNNIFVGTKSPALRSTGRMIENDFDSDGYAWGIGAGDFAVWNDRRYRSLGDAKTSKRLYRSRGAYSLYNHRTFMDGFLPPSKYQDEYREADNVPLLRPDSQAIDKGEVIPNFSDGFSGRAPDLGCCDLTEGLPVYGPRP